MDFVENIQQKSEPTRKLIAAALVVFFMLIIIGVWMTTFSLPDNSARESISDQPSPLSLLWNFITDSVEQIYR